MLVFEVLTNFLTFNSLSLFLIDCLRKIVAEPNVFSHFVYYRDVPYTSMFGVA